MSARTLLLNLVISTVVFFGSLTYARGDMPAPFAAMEMAILERDLSAVRRLVESGEDIDQKMFNDETPAILASKADAWDIVLYLLREEAAPGAQDAMGASIASFAVDSRVEPDSEEGQALSEVREILSQRGLL